MPNRWNKKSGKDPKVPLKNIRNGNCKIEHPIRHAINIHLGVNFEEYLFKIRFI